MRHAIARASAIENIECVQHLIKHVNPIQNQSLAERVYTVYVSKSTGRWIPAADVRQSLSEEQWQSVTVRASLAEWFKVKSGKIFVADSADYMSSITIDALNRIAADLLNTEKEMCDLDVLLNRLSVMEVSPAYFPKDVLSRAWYSVDREGAEELLRDEPAGAFLFRIDDFALMFERRSPEAIHCITLTYVKSNADHANERHIVDDMLIQKEGRWHVFEDNIGIYGKGYSTLNALIDARKEDLIVPLLKRS